MEDGINGCSAFFSRRGKCDFLSSPFPPRYGLDVFPPPLFSDRFESNLSDPLFSLFFSKKTRAKLNEDTAPLSFLPSSCPKIEYGTRSSLFPLFFSFFFFFQLRGGPSFPFFSFSLLGFDCSPREWQKQSLSAPSSRAGPSSRE